MSLIKLKTLGITLNKNNYSLRYDGFVEDLIEHSRKVLSEFGATKKEIDTALKVHSTDYRDLSLEEGRFLGMADDDGKKINYVIFLKNKNDRLLNTFNKGHEETHVLHHMAELPLLEKKLKSKNVSIDLSDLYSYEEVSSQEHEIVANIGGLCGLHRNNFNMAYVFSHRFPESRIKDRPDMKVAVDAYKMALKSKKF